MSVQGRERFVINLFALSDTFKVMFRFVDCKQHDAPSEIYI